MSSEQAVKLGLPPDAPLQALQAFCTMLSQTKGSKKDTAVQTEEKNKLTGIIKDWMKRRCLGFVPVGQRGFLILKSEQKPIPWSEELVGKSLVAFLERTPPSAALSRQDWTMKYLAFANDVRKASGEQCESLKLVAKLPISASLQTALGTL